MIRRPAGGTLSALARLGLIALPVAGVTGCAALVPAVVIPQVAVTAGVAGLSGLACAGESSCEAPAAACTDSAGRKIEATETAGLAIPADEGAVVSFAPAYWQPQFVTGDAPKADRAAGASAGAFVVTDKSVLFVPPAGMDGVRIPLAGVLDVTTQASATTARRGSSPWSPASAGSIASPSGRSASPAGSIRRRPPPPPRKSGRGSPRGAAAQSRAAPVRRSVRAHAARHPGTAVGGVTTWPTAPTSRS